MDKWIFKLIEKTSTDLPSDVEEALREALAFEEGRAAAILREMLRNVEVARERNLPICQDTGTPIFYVQKPKEIPQKEIEVSINEAVKKATEKSLLRPNAIDPITQMNTGSNAQVIHFAEGDKLQIDLMLKGGGSENVSSQYSMPCPRINAGRDLAGVRRAVLDSVFRAQGKGCAPGILGVCIGGDRATGYELAKRQLLRRLGDVNQDGELAKLEKRLFADINNLGIGPLGLGGKTTVLGVKVCKAHRIPASFFVSVMYMCWACRRRRLVIEDGKIT